MDLAQRIQELIGGVGKRIQEIIPDRGTSTQVPLPRRTPIQQFAASPLGQRISAPGFGEEFSEFARAQPREFEKAIETPIPYVSGIAGVRTLQRAAANTGRAVGEGLVGMGSGAHRYAKGTQEGDFLKQIAGLGEVVYSGSKPIAASMPLIQGANLLASAPQFGGAGDIPRRAAAGLLEKATLTEGLAENVPTQNTVRLTLPILGEIEIDPWRTAGGVVGFTQNPVNKKLFQFTEGAMPTGNVFTGTWQQLSQKGATAALSNVFKWVFINGVRGSIEDILIDMKDMPDDVPLSQKLEFMGNSAIVGALTEIFGRAILNAGGTALNPNLSKAAKEQIGELFDALKKNTDELTKPLTTPEGVQPAWRVMIQDQRGSVQLGPEDAVMRMKSEAIKQLDFLKNQDTTIPQNIGELINRIDVSSAKTPQEAAQMILKNLPENVRVHEKVVQTIGRETKQFSEAIKAGDQRAETADTGKGIEARAKEAPVSEQSPVVETLTRQAARFQTSEAYEEFLKTSGGHQNSLGLVKELGYKNINDFYKKNELDIAKQRATVGAPPPKGKLPKYAPENFNLEQMNAPDDVKRFALGWRNQNKQALEQAYKETTGKNFMQEVRKLAAETNIKDANQFIKQGKYDIESVAGRKKLLADFLVISEIHKNLNQEMSAIKEVLQNDEAPKAIKEEAGARLIANNSKLLTTAYSLQGRSSLAGQFLNLHKQLMNALSETDEGARLVEASKVLKKQFGLSGEDLTKALEAFSKIDQTEPEAVSKWLTDMASIKGNKTDLFTAFFYNNILSSITAHQANMFGNTFSILSNELLVRPTALGLEGRTPKQALRELAPAYVGGINSIPKAVHRALMTFKTGFDPEEITNPSKWSPYTIDPYTISKSSFLRRAAPLLSASTRALKAEDAFFKTLLYETELEARVMRGNEFDELN